MPEALTRLAAERERHLLRELPGRRVWREGEIVIKAFRHPAPWWRWRDRWRARNEVAVLSFLHARGLCVPRALGVERADGWWHARLEWIEDARTLEEPLQAGPGLGSSRGRLASSVGAAVARLHLAGVDQPDFHAGNFLVDRAARIWAIDFHKARLRPHLGRRRLLASLARLGGEVRERTTPRERARFFAAWWRALGDDLRRELGARAELAHELERLARADRLATVKENLDRWLRESERCRAIRARGGEHLLRRDLEARRQSEFEAALTGGAAPERALVHRGTRRSVRSRWLAAARLCEHGLPAARPAALCLSRRAALALYELPWNGEPLGEARLSPAALERSQRELSALCAAALERGLVRGSDAQDWSAGLELWVEPTRGAIICLPRADS